MNLDDLSETDMLRSTDRHGTGWLGRRFDAFLIIFGRVIGDMFGDGNSVMQTSHATHDAIRRFERLALTEKYVDAVSSSRHISALPCQAQRLSPS